MELMTSSPDGLGTLSARGLLSAFGDDDGAKRHVGGVFMDFDYRRDGVVEFAEQSFGVGPHVRVPLSPTLRLATDISAEAVPILAVRDGYGKPITWSTLRLRRRCRWPRPGGTGIPGAALSLREWTGLLGSHTQRGRRNRSWSSWQTRRSASLSCGACQPGLATSSTGRSAPIPTAPPKPGASGVCRSFFRAVTSRPRRTGLGLDQSRKID
jgi:hypothetical protein